jgi:hypothetical protein
VARRVGETVSPGRPGRPAEAELPEVSPPIADEGIQHEQQAIRATWAPGKDYTAILPFAYSVTAVAGNVGIANATRLSADYTIPAGGLADGGGQYEVYVEGDFKWGPSGNRRTITIALQIGAADQASITETQAVIAFNQAAFDWAGAWWARGTLTLISDNPGVVDPDDPDPDPNARNSFLSVIGALHPEHADSGNGGGPFYGGEFGQVPDSGSLPGATMPWAHLRAVNLTQPNLFRLVAWMEATGGPQRLTSFYTRITRRGA